MGLRRAFATRGWKPGTATAAQIFTIACDFGVGYGTLLTHLSAGVNMISRARAAALQRVTPKALRADILGALTPEPLIIADRHRAGPTLDAEVKMLLLLPPGTEITGASLAYERDLASGRLFRAVRPGIVQASANSGAWAVFVRIAPRLRHGWRVRPVGPRRGAPYRQAPTGQSDRHAAKHGRGGQLSRRELHLQRGAQRRNLDRIDLIGRTPGPPHRHAGRAVRCDETVMAGNAGHRNECVHCLP
jgi:hypothetical protein